MMIGESGMFFGGYMWLFWLLVIAAIVVVIMSAINTKSAGGSKVEDSPLEILKRRYARGEIDEEEFTRRRKQIES